MSLALSLYHRLPVRSRSLVASARGYYLSWWRYDRRTEELVEAALERDHWTRSEWEAWQDERLHYVLRRAAEQAPHYRRMWEERRQKGDRSSLEKLENWPILEKKILKERGKDFIADDCSQSKMYHDHTSGTTGTSLSIWLNRDTVKQWYALHEARCRRWYGMNRRDRWAMLGGQLVVPAQQKSAPFWVWNRGLNQLYMSAYHISPQTARDYLRALTTYNIKYILGYPSAIYSLAQEAVRSRPAGLQIETVVVNAEPLYDHQRSTIAEAFNCPVRETYGMAEIAAAASECEQGKLHLWPEAGIVEADGTESSDLICTGLINDDMPLIRYRVGDRGRLSHEECKCGRLLPVLDGIDGRCDDVLYTSDGRAVGRMDPVFKNDLPILEAQIIQESLHRIAVKYVRADGFHQNALRDLSDRIRDRLGDIQVELEEVTEIARTNNGKFRAVICNLPKEVVEELKSPLTLKK